MAQDNARKRNFTHNAHKSIECLTSGDKMNKYTKRENHKDYYTQTKTLRESSLYL